MESTTTGSGSSKGYRVLPEALQDEPIFQPTEDISSYEDQKDAKSTYVHI
jgi:hypothetical protein